MTTARRACLFAAAFAVCVAFLYGQCSDLSCGKTVRNGLWRPLAGILNLQIPHCEIKPTGTVHPHVSHVAGHIEGHYTPSHTITPGDTLPVVVDIDIRPGDTLATVSIGGDTVRVDSIRVRAQVTPLCWRVYAEAGLVPGPEADLAAGIAWEPIRPLGVQLGPCVSVDLPDGGWLAVGGRVSRRLHSTLDVGGSIGYRLGLRDGEPSGLHVGVSCGFAF